MTSKISSVKLFKESLKRNGAMAALLMLIYFCCFPLASMLMMRDWSSWYTAKETWMIKEMRWLLAYNEMFLFLTMGFAAVLGILQFAYLHNREKLDFYHSFPVRREKLFAIRYVSGVAVWLVPYVVNLLLALSLTGFKGYGDSITFMQAVKGIGVQLVCFLLIYSFMILAMMLTGKIFTAILGMGVFSVFCPMFLLLLDGMCTEYFTTYISAFADGKYMLLSPVSVCVELLTRFAEPERCSKDLLLGLFLLALLVAGICVCLYRYRSTESAGRSMAFSKAARVIKFVLVVCISSGGELVFHAMNGSSGWGIFGLLFGFVLSTAIIEFIYRMDIREVFADKRQMLLSLAVVLFVFMFFQFDLSGYDKKLPAKEQVESVQIHAAHAVNYGPESGMLRSYDLLTNQNGELLYQLQGYVDREAPDVKNLDAVYELLENRKSREEVKAEGYSATLNLQFTFYMKNGTRKERLYSFDREAFWQYFGAIWESEEYKRNLIPVWNVEPESILDLAVGIGYIYDEKVSAEDVDPDLYMSAEIAELSASEEIRTDTWTDYELELSREEKETLFETMRDEMLGMPLEQVSMDYIDYEAKMRIVYPGEDGKVYGDTFYVTEAFTETVELLREYGYQFPETEE